MNIQNEVFPIFSHINNIVNPVIEKEDLSLAFNDKEWLDKRVESVDEKLAALPKKVQDDRIQKIVKELDPAWKDFVRQLNQAVSKNEAVSDDLQAAGKKISALAQELRKPIDLKIDSAKNSKKKSPLTKKPTKELLKKAKKFFVIKQQNEIEQTNVFLEKARALLKEVNKSFDKKIKKVQKAHPKAKITFTAKTEKVIKMLSKLDQKRLQKLCGISVKDIENEKVLKIRDKFFSKLKSIKLKKSKPIQKEFNKDIELKTYVVSLFAKIYKGKYGKKIQKEFEDVSETVFANEAFLKLLLINTIKHHNTPQALQLLVSDQSKDAKKLFKYLEKLKNDEIENLLFSSQDNEQTKTLNRLIAIMVSDLEKGLRKNLRCCFNFIFAAQGFLFSIKAEVTKSGEKIETIKCNSEKNLIKYFEIMAELPDSSDDESEIDDSSDDESDDESDLSSAGPAEQSSVGGVPLSNQVDEESDSDDEEDDDKNEFFTDLFKSVRKFEAHLQHK